MQKIISTPHSKIEMTTFGKKDLNSIDFSSPSSAQQIKDFLSERYGSPKENIFGLNQVHGVQIFKAEESHPPLTGDGLWTERKDFLLYVKTADCMPLFFWSHTHPLIGILHSGWKGTRDGITQKMIAHIRHIYPSIGLMFFLGPCIRGYEYEVKEDVSTYFESFQSGIMKKEGKIYLGLENVVHEVLNECDIEIDDSNLSTLSHPDYFSHRGKDTGRNINVIRFIP
jgi:YfiH family protein